MYRLLSCGFAGLAVLLLAAGDGQTNGVVETAAEEDLVARQAFQDEWKVVSVTLKQALKKGQMLPAPSEVLKFEGVKLPSAIPP